MNVLTKHMRMKRWGKKKSYLTTFCLEFGFCSSHSMSRELDDGNWWWHGKVALSPTTFFISVWAPADSRLQRTEEEDERGKRYRDVRWGHSLDPDLRQEADAADRKQKPCRYRKLRRTTQREM